MAQPSSGVFNEEAIQQVQKDVEAARDKTEHLQGYAEFSNFIASDDSLSIYRKFAALGARNLLYLQSELQMMEFELQSLDDLEKERMGGPGDIGEKLLQDIATRSWEDMKKLAQSGDTTQAAKLEIIYKTRELMEMYETALLRRNQILQLEKPENGPLEAFTTWFRTKNPLWGYGHSLLNEESDIVSLGIQVEPDRITSIMHRCLGYRLRKHRNTPKSWGYIYYYPSGIVTLVVSFLSVLTSAALLIGAIVTLHFVKSMEIRLGIVGAFVVLFAGSLTLFTNARRIEVYGATAAYAAVLVVFISVNV